MDTVEEAMSAVLRLQRSRSRSEIGAKGQNVPTFSGVVPTCNRISIRCPLCHVFHISQ
jgi:hypothetical protein